MTLPDLDTYQAAVKRLTAENRELKEQLRLERAVHRQKVRELTGQISEGLTPELLVLRREVIKWRTRAQAAELRLKEARKNA